MNKATSIICIIDIFSLNQKINVLDEKGEILKTENVGIDRLPNTLFALSEKNNVDNINLTKSEYSEIVKEKIEELSILRYGQNKSLTVTII